MAYNPFGDQNFAAAKKYVTGDQYYHLITRQHVVAANLTGQLVDPPVVPQSTTITNAAYFDEIGRSFGIGAKFKY